MSNSLYKDKPRLLLLFILIAASSLFIRFLFEYRFHNSALLYVGIPFLLSLILIGVRSPDENPSWKKRYLNTLIDAFIIMLGSSVVLFEGFVCVVMVIPIFIIGFTIAFITTAYSERIKKQKSGTLHAHIFPLLILLTAFEGINEDVSFNRNETVSVSQIVQTSIAEINNNLIKPIDLNKDRPWFLKLFPMPDYIQAESLSPGDIHIIHFSYYRWFVTNLHEGSMKLEISEVTDNRIKTTFIEDTSYIANYLTLHGTEILLEKIDDGHTKVTLTINFERKLDPYWYFSPIERYGISKTAEFLISEVISRE